MKFSIFVLFGFLLVSTEASAQWCVGRTPQAPLSECDYCQCSQGLSPLETGASGIRFEVRSLMLGNRFQGASKEANPDNLNESYLTNQFSFFYRIAGSPLTVMAGVPYVIRTMRDYPEAGGMDVMSMSANGLGDVSLMLHVTDQSSWDDALVVLSASAGVKLPTGRTDARSEGELIDVDMQPGSGSTDWLVGAGAIWSMDRTTVALNTLGGITGTGARGHRFGNYINGELAARYRIVPNDISSSALFVTLGLGGEVRAMELQDGMTMDNSGGSIFYVAPGLNYHINEVLSLDAKAEIPLHQYLGGEQFGESYRLVGGLQWLL